MTLGESRDGITLIRCSRQLPVSDVFVVEPVPNWLIRQGVLPISWIKLLYCRSGVELYDATLHAETEYTSRNAGCLTGGNPRLLSPNRSPTLRRMRVANENQDQQKTECSAPIITTSCATPGCLG